MSPKNQSVFKLLKEVTFHCSTASVCGRLLSQKRYDRITCWHGLYQNRAGKSFNKDLTAANGERI